MKKVNGDLSWGQHKLIYAGVSDTGQVRKANEDDFIILPEHGLFLVADGMGGHEAGAVASRATTASAEKFMNYRADPMEATMPHGLSEDALQDSPLRGIAHYANELVYHEAAGRVMGSTLVAAHFSDSELNLAHVGDSRAYLWRNGQLKQITEDHSLVNELFRAGEISRDEMRTHPRRNVITRAIGTNIQVEPNLQQLEVVAGDLLLLCSDGLTSMASDDEISQIIRLEKDIPALADTLVRLANDAGGKDNITAIVVSIN